MRRVGEEKERDGSSRYWCGLTGGRTVLEGPPAARVQTASPTASFWTLFHQFSAWSHLDSTTYDAMSDKHDMLLPSALPFASTTCTPHQPRHHTSLDHLPRPHMDVLQALALLEAVGAVVHRRRAGRAARAPILALAEAEELLAQKRGRAYCAVK